MPVTRLGSHMLAIVGLAALASISYWPIVNAGFVWDDDAYVTENDAVHTAAGLFRIWFEPGSTPQYYPLVFTAFWAQYQLWGASAFAYHLVNVALHVLCAVLLWRIAKQLSLPGAWILAAVFTVHPVHVESVAWITELKNVMSLFFYLAAMWSFLRSLGIGQAARAHQRGWYVCSLMLFICALLSKTVTCSLPVALLLILWWRHPTPAWRHYALLIPMFIIGLIAGLFTAWFEQAHVGARGGLFDATPAEHIILAGRIVCFYAAKLLWPVDISFIYTRWDIAQATWWQYLFPAGATCALSIAWARRHQWGKGPLVGLLFFTVTLFPAMGFFDVYFMIYSYVADHFQYHASIGFLALVVAIMTHTLRQQHLRYALFSVLIAALSLLTMQRTRVFANAETLWLDTLNKNPQAWMAHNNLGTLYQQQGKLDAAKKHYQAALAIQPQFAYAHNNLGLLLQHQQHLDQASVHFAHALDIDPNNARILENAVTAHLLLGQQSQALSLAQRLITQHPDALRSHLAMGRVWEAMGSLDDAAAHYRTALTFDPRNAEALNYVGVALYRQGKFEEAELHFASALQAVPDNAALHNSLGNVLFGRKRLDAAIRQFQIAIDLDAQHLEAHLNLGDALRAVGQDAQGLQVYERAVDIAPESTEALNRLAIALSQGGHTAQAIPLLERAVSIQPRAAPTHVNIGVMYLRLNELDKAAMHLSTAIQLQPDLEQAHLSLAQVTLIQGKQQQTIDHLQSVLELNPDHRQARQMLERIRSQSP